MKANITVPKRSYSITRQDSLENAPLPTFTAVSLCTGDFRFRLPVQMLSDPLFCPARKQ